MTDAARVKADQTAVILWEVLGSLVLAPGAVSQKKLDVLDVLIDSLDAFAAERESETWKAAIALVPPHCNRCLHDPCEALRRVAHTLRGQIER